MDQRLFVLARPVPAIVQVGGAGAHEPSGTLLRPHLCSDAVPGAYCIPPTAHRAAHAAACVGAVSRVHSGTADETPPHRRRVSRRPTLSVSVPLCCGCLVFACHLAMSRSRVLSLVCPLFVVAWKHRGLAFVLADGHAGVFGCRVAQVRCKGRPKSVRVLTRNRLLGFFARSSRSCLNRKLGVQQGLVGGNSRAGMS